MKYKYLLFDADNTLFNFDAAERNAFLALNSVIWGAFPAEAYSLYHDTNKRIWKDLELGKITKSELKLKRFVDYLDTVHVIHNEETVKSVADAYLSALSKETVLIEGVLPTLEYLSQKYRIFIVTNGISAVQRPRLKSSEIQKYVEDIFISEEIGYEKPDKRFFDRVLRNIGDLDTEAYLVVGDSVSSDINGAYNSNIDAVYFTPDLPTTLGTTAKYIITSISELTDLL